MSGRGGRGAEMIIADSTRVAGMEQIGADEHDKVQQGQPKTETSVECPSRTSMSGQMHHDVP